MLTSTRDVFFERKLNSAQHTVSQTQRGYFPSDVDTQGFRDDEHQEMKKLTSQDYRDSFHRESYRQKGEMWQNVD